MAHHHLTSSTVAPQTAHSSTVAQELPGEPDSRTNEQLKPNSPKITQKLQPESRTTNYSAKQTHNNG